jgi:hypothetical protein
MSGSQLGGALSGAVAGAEIGGPWGAVVGGLLGFLSGDSGSSAKTDKLYSEYNAKMTRAAGKANAAAIAGMAQANSDITMQLAGMNLNARNTIDSYNAHLKSFLGDYNASLLEAEAQNVWDKANLDITQMNNVFARQMGQIKTGYGASGVMMNQDTPLQAQIDAGTQHAMDVMIVQHGADIQSKKILDSAARSRWEGNMAAATIMYEGQINGTMSYANSVMSAAGTAVQGDINSRMTLYNSEVDAEKITKKGENDYKSWQSKDNQSLFSGILKGATTYLAGEYGNDDTSSTTTLDTSGTKLSSDTYDKNLISGLFGPSSNANDSSGSGRFNVGDWSTYGGSLIGN